MWKLTCAQHACCSLGNDDDDDDIGVRDLAWMLRSSSNSHVYQRQNVYDLYSTLFSDPVELSLDEPEHV